MQHFRRAWAGLCLLALMVGPRARRTLGGRRGDASATAADRRAAERRAGRAPDARPNIVVVMLDDFSMDLVQTMRSVQRMRKAGASYPHSFVTDSLCCVSRSSFFTGQYPHQTGVRTNTSNQGTSMLGGWAAYDTNGNPERAFNVRLQEAGYTTGFVGKFLNEYEWSPGRALPPVVPGWSTFNTVFGSAYDGWDFASTSVVDGRMRLTQHDAPPASASDAREGQGVRRHGDRRPGDGLPRRQRGRGRAVLPRGRALRAAQPHPARRATTPGDPLFPPMFRDRDGRAQLRAGGVRAS